MLNMSLTKLEVGKKIHECRISITRPGYGVQNERNALTKSVMTLYV